MDGEHRGSRIFRPKFVNDGKRDVIDLNREKNKKMVKEKFEEISEHLDMFFSLFREDIKEIQQGFFDIAGNRLLDSSEFVGGIEFMKFVSESIVANLNAILDLYRNIDEVMKLDLGFGDFVDFGGVHGELLKEIEERLQASDRSREGNKKVVALGANKEKIKDKIRLAILKFLDTIEILVGELDYSEWQTDDLTMNEKIGKVQDKLANSLHYFELIENLFKEQMDILPAAMKSCL